MAVPNVWEYTASRVITDNDQGSMPKRVRVVTCLDRGLFSDAMYDVMEQERFEVIAFEQPDSIVDLASTADACLLDMAADGAPATLVALAQECSHVRLVVLADACTSGTARALMRTAPHAYVTDGDSLDLVLALLRGEEAPVECRGSREGRSATDTGGERDLSRLTARESEILEGLLDGENTKVLAARLGVSPATARAHVQSVLNKLGVHSRLEAVARVNGGMRGDFSAPAGDRDAHA